MTKNGNGVSYKWLTGILAGILLTIAGAWATWVTSTLTSVERTVERIEHNQTNPHLAAKD